MNWAALSIGMTMAATGPATTLSTHAAVTPPFGIYGGDQVRLDLSANGGRLETACAAGTIDGPLTFDDRGHFVAAGSFETYASGPQAADAPPALARVRYTGDLADHELTLTVEASGATPPTILRLHYGRRSKIIRCL